MEKKYLRAIILTAILFLIIGLIFLFLKKERIVKNEKAPAKEREEKREGEYKPLLKPLQEERLKEEGEEEKKEKEEKFKIIEKIGDLEPEKISPQKKEEIKQELEEINREFKKKPSLKEIEDLKKKRVVIY